MKFLHTPGHGYLIVPRKDFVESGFVPTEYSLHNRDFAYLEEDCDAPAFMKIANITSVEEIHGDDLPEGLSYFEISPNQISTYEKIVREAIERS